MDLLLLKLAKLFGLKKDEVFAKASQFFKFLKTIKSYNGGAISEQLLASYQPKNYMFKALNTYPQELDEGAPDVRVKVIPEKDAYALMVGLDTNCCQHIGGAANDVTIDSLIGKDSGVLMFEYKTRIPNIGHHKSIEEGYELFAQAFTSIYKGYVILDNIEYVSRASVTKDRLYSCLKMLSKKCEERGLSLICGSSGLLLMRAILAS